MALHNTNVSSSQYQLDIAYFFLFLIITSTVIITIITTVYTTGMEMAATIPPVRSEGEVVSMSCEQLVSLQSTVGVEEGRGSVPNDINSTCTYICTRYHTS